jgi:signal peptidase I
VAAPAPDLARARRDAAGFAADARRLASRAGSRLPARAREAVLAAADGVEEAAAGGDPERLSTALRTLDALWEEHLEARAASPWRDYAVAIVLAVALSLVVRAFVVEAFRIPSGSMAPTLLAGDHVLVSKLDYGLRLPFTQVRLVELGVPRRGDIVVFDSPREPGRDVVKRVVGVPGDVVELRDAVLHVNGVPQPRSPAGELTYEDLGPDGARAAETCPRFRESLAKGVLAEPRGEREGAAEASWQGAAVAGVASYDVLQCRRVRFASREGPFEVVRPGHVFVLGDNRDRSADSRGSGGWQVPFDHVSGRARMVFWSWGLRGPGPEGEAGLRLDRLFKPVE